jgi:hypothetical protein
MNTPQERGGDKARPSRAEYQQELHAYPQTNPEALRQEGLEPGEEHYHIIEDDPQSPRRLKGDRGPGALNSALSQERGFGPFVGLCVCARSM